MTLKRVFPFFAFLVLFLVVCPRTASAQTVLTFPRVITDTGVFTGVAVGNPTATDVSVTFTAFQADGSTASGTGVRNPVTINIPAGGQIARLASEIFGLTRFNGWVQATSGTTGLTGFFLNGNGINDLDGAASTQAATDLVIPIAVQDATVQSEISIVNSGADPAHATITLYGLDGQAIASKDVTLPGRGLIRQTLPVLIGSADFSTGSHVRIRSDRPVVAHGVVVNFLLKGSSVRRESVAIAGQRPVAGQTYVLPQFATGNGWISLVGLVNAGGIVQDVTLTAYREDGSVWPAPNNPRRLSLNANAGLRESVSDLFGFAGNSYFTGWIGVTSSVGFLQGYIGYGNTTTPSFALAAATETSSASRFQVLSQVAEGAGYYTGLTVVNPGKTDAVVEFFTLRPDGTTVGRSSFTVKPNARVAKLFRELLPASLEQVGGWGFLRSSQPVIGAALFGSTSGLALASVPPQLPAGDFLPPAPLTAAITGLVAMGGAGVEAVQVRLAGPVNATKTTDAYGHYIFTQLPKGQYTVTVAKAGSTFVRSQQSVTVDKDNVENIDFEASGVTPAGTPVVSFISPASAFAGIRAVNIRVFGSNFTSASIVRLNDQPLQTAYISSAEIQAVISQPDLAVARSVRVVVETPPPGGGQSGVVNFAINSFPSDPLIEGRAGAGSVPSGIAMDTRRNHALVSNQSGDSVSVVDLKTLSTLATIKVGRSPADGIAISSVRDVALVANPGSNNVSVIDLTANTELKRITVGAFPVGLAIDDGIKRAFVANQISGSISVIDLDTLTETGKFQAGEFPSNIAVNTKTHVGIVSNLQSGTVTVFNASTNAVLGSIAVGARPRGVAINPDTNQAVVANANSNDVWIVNLTTGSVVRKVPVGAGPTDIDIHLLTNTAIVTNSTLTPVQREAGQLGSVSAIDLATGEVTEIPVGATPFGIAVDPDNQRAVIADFGSDDITIVRIPNPKPRITDILPKAFPAGGGPFTITIQGSGFVPMSVATLNGQPLPTTYVSRTELKADVTAALLDQFLRRAIDNNSIKGLRFAATATPQFTVHVGNPSPGGGESPNDASSELVLQNEAPVLTSISPTSIQANTTDLTLTLNGNNFSLASIINFGSNAYSPATVSGVVMTVIIPRADLPSGKVQVSVTNQAPGGGTAGPLPFQVNPQVNPMPVVSSVDTTAVAVGAAPTSVIVLGSGFFAGTTATLNGVTGVVNGNSITFTLPSSQFSSAGTLYGVITNGEPGGGSASFSVNVLNPAPTITGFTPTTALAGTPGVTLDVTGSNFRTGTQVTVEGTPLATTVVSQNQLRAAMTEVFLNRSASWHIGVLNQAPGGGFVEGGVFTINNPVPTLSELSPSALPVQNISSTLNVIGTGFSGNSKVTLNGTAVDVRFDSNTKLIATIPAAMLQVPAAYDVQVTNPAPGGGLTQTLRLVVDIGVPVLETVSPDKIRADQQNVLFQITGRSFANNSVVNIGPIALTAMFASPTQLSVVLPQPPLGRVNVTVKNPASGYVSNAVEIEIAPLPPVITSVTPNPASGGQVLRIVGTNFGVGSALLFGGAPIPATVTSTTELSFTVPLQTPLGPVDLIVRNPATSTNPTLDSPAFSIAIVNPVPSISTLDPSTALPGDRITVTGAGFLMTSQVTINGNAVTSTFVSPSTLTFVVPLTLVAGSASVVVNNPGPGGGPSKPASLTVVNPVPAITSLDPASGTTGSTVTLNVNGSNFVNGAMVKFGDTQVAATVSSPTSLSATIVLPGVAGIVNVTVVNPGTVASNALQFTVGARAVITNISPTSGVQGQSVDVVITGTAFASGATVSISGDGVTATNVTVNSSTEIAATFTIDAAASTGTRNVTVTTPNWGISVNAVDFVVLRSPPSLVSILPTTLVQGSGVIVTLVGKGFSGTDGLVGSVTGVTVSGGGITVSNLQVSNDTTLTATFMVAPNAAATLRSVSVTTTGGTTGPVLFTVQPLVSITAISKSIGGPGTLFETLTGTNLLGATAVTFSGTGVTGTIAAGGTATSLPIRIDIDPGAPAGLRTITVTAGGLTSQPYSGFTVSSTIPVIGGITPTSAFKGTTIAATISGSNLSGATAVDFFATGITAAIDAGGTATALPVHVTVGTSSVNSLFTVTSPQGTSSRNLNVGLNVIDPIYYPFEGTPDDASGGGFTFVSRNVSYQNGALLVNGLYDFDFPVTGYKAQTPNIPPLNYGDLTVSADFNADADFAHRPILVGGSSYRWFIVDVGADHELIVSLNNHNLTFGTGWFLQPGRWYNVAFSLDANARALRLFLDGVLVLDQALPVGFQQDVVTANVQDKLVTLEDYSTARAYKGLLDNLTIYGRAATSVPAVTDMSPTFADVALGPVDVTLTGAGFQNGASVISNNLGLATVSNVVVVDDKKITLRLMPLVAGSLTLRVTNPDGIFATSRPLVLGHAPSALVLTSSAAAVTPNTITMLSVTVIDDLGNTVTAAAPVVTLAATPTTTVVVSPVSTFTKGVATALFSSATPGTYQITAVANNLTPGNTIVTILGAPTLLPLNPPSAAQGSTVSVTLSGTNFAPGATSVSVSGTAVVVSNVAVSDPSSLAATFFVTGTALLGDRAVTVSTSAGTSNPTTFTVTPGCVPSIALGQNMVMNGSADADFGTTDFATIVVPSCWQTTGSMTAVQYGTTGFPISGDGMNLFAGGPGSGISTASQTLDVSSLAASIDTGLVVARLGALLGDGGSGNHATVSVQFFSGSTQLGILTVGPSAGLPNGQLGSAVSFLDVPVGTRSIVVSVSAGPDPGALKVEQPAQKVAAPYNDAYADAISLVLKLPDRTWAGGGATNPSDWGNPANWSPAGVPTGFENIYVPATNNPPALSAAAAAVQNVKVASGATLNIGSGSQLFVFGNLKGSLTGSGTVTMSGLNRISGTVPNLQVQGQTLAENSLIVAGSATAIGLFDIGSAVVNVKGPFFTSGTGVVVMASTSGILNVDGDATFQGGDEQNLLTAGMLNIKGNFLQTGASLFRFVATGTHTVVLNGTNPQTVRFVDSANNSFQNLTISNSSGVVLNSSIVANGDVNLNAGKLDMNGQLFSVSGNFSTVGTGALRMDANTNLSVRGDVSFGGASTAGLLQAGFLVFGGSFTQLNNGNISDTFAPSGTETQFDIFLGQSTTHNISFANTTNSHFNTLLINSTTDKITLLSDVVTTGAFLAPANNFVKGIVGGGHTLTVAGVVDVDSLDLDNVLFVINGGTISKFDRVQFLNYLPTATPLTISHPGGTFTLNNLVFNTIPTTGFYIEATDTAPTDSTNLTITLMNATPPAQAAKTKANPPAVIVWP